MQQTVNKQLWRMHCLQQSRSPERAAFDNVCDVTQQQVISCVWLVAAVLLHGLCICDPRELLWKLHIQNLQQKLTELNSKIA